MYRTGALLAVITLLLGCSAGDVAAPVADSRVPTGLSAGQFPPIGWAWGYIQTGDRPPQRYGVTSPPIVPRADLVILPGYGESAEVWFETVRDLVARGYTVWVLERAGQGGSGRFLTSRELGYVPSFEPDVSTLRAFVRTVVRPGLGRPVILLGYADGAVVGLRAVQTGLAVDAMVLESPRLGKRLSNRTIGLERLPSPGWKSWSRARPDAFTQGLTHDRLRGRIGMAWQTSNPDIRMSEPSRGWTAAFGEASHQAMSQPTEVRVPVLIITGDAPGPPVSTFCDLAAQCRTRALSGAREALHLEADAWRTQWLDVIVDFTAGLSITPITAHEP